MYYKYTLLIFFVYVIAQTIFSLYYYIKGKNLSKITYTGIFRIGNKNNPKFKLYVSGDSVATGVGASSLHKSTAFRIAKAISKKKYVTLTNRGVSGFKVNDLIFQKSPKFQDLIVLIISSNDLFHFTNIKKFELQARKLINIYQKLAKKVIILGPLRVDTATAIPLFYRPIYYYKGFKYLNILKKISSKYKNVAHTSSYYLKSKKQYGNIEGKDRFHPSDEGHRMYANMIIKLVKS